MAESACGHSPYIDTDRYTHLAEATYPMVKLDNLSMAQLSELEVELRATVSQRETEEREAVKKQLIDQAAAAGFTIQELFGSRAKGSRSVVVPKYRNPANSRETWSGRGRRPRWLEAALRKLGTKLEDFLIT